MSSVISPLQAPADATERLRAALNHVWQSWRSVRWYEAIVCVALGLLYGLVDLTALADWKDMARPWSLFWRLLLTPLICSVVLVLAWLPADRSDPQHRLRNRRLMWAAVLSSMVAVPVVWGVSALAHWPDYMDLCAPKCKGSLTVGQRFAADFLSTLLPAILLVGVVEMLRRRWRDEAALQSILNEQASLGRQAMAARLAAMQAQVEPQFLFDVLVDVQQQYARSRSDQAAEQLERLIHHLRVALPRLREQNVTTLDAEAALLASYLALRQGLERRAVSFDDRLPPTLRAATVPAMLLLPLLQRALRLSARGLPEHVSIAADRRANTLMLELQVSTAGLCGQDADLAAQRERLTVLAGPSARLTCMEDGDATHFTLELPA